MSLFNEYQTLTHLECPSQQDLERMAEIVEILSSDEEEFSAIMHLEYLLAQNEGLLSEDNIQQYLKSRATLSDWIEVDLAMRSTYSSHGTRTSIAKH